MSGKKLLSQGFVKGSEEREEKRGQWRNRVKKDGSMRAGRMGKEGCSLRRDEFAPRADSGHARSARDCEGIRGSPHWLV